MTAFTSVPALPDAAPPDPSKHVNYTLGMVLGVDDFEQEFAYGSGRDRWAVRDLVGYGTAWGLRVTVETTTDGPRVHVSSGVAVVPSGELVCVAPAQCAALGDWLRANAAAVEATSSLPPAEVRLALVACYRECLVDDVPIPGEPCRSEDELMAPSRRQDDFLLELRLDAPPQPEDDAVRLWTAWLKTVPVIPGAAAPGDLDAFLQAIRDAAGPEGTPPPPLALPSLPGDLVIPADDAAEFLTAAFRLWTTELRGRWRTPAPGADCGCGPGAVSPAEDADCVLLAELVVPLVVDETTGDLLVSSESPVVVDEARRPLLVHQRMLQEWLLAGGLTLPATSSPTPEPAPDTSLPRIVAAGRVDGDGAASGPDDFLSGGLRVTKLEDGAYHLKFDDYEDGARYTVTGTAVVSLSDTTRHALELIPRDDPDAAALVGGAGLEPGLVIRLLDADGHGPALGFGVQITRHQEVFS